MLEVHGVGRLCNDAEVFNYSNGNGSGVKFRLACNNGINNGDVNFVECVIFNRDENLAQYLKQGNQIIVSGDLKIKYDPESNRSYTQIIVNNFDFGARKQ